MSQQDKKLIIANWKMYKNLSDAKVFVENFPKDAEVVLCPPFTLLSYISDVYKNIGAQDCSALSLKEGAFTGDISADMLRNMGCKYVIIGHSERRKYHNESADLIKKKIINAHQAGLIAILCLGETIDLRNNGEYKNFLANELKKSVPDSSNTDNLIIAYEPIWAIGTGMSATCDQIEKMHEYLLENFISRFAFIPKIIYGGSVNLENAQKILDIKNVSGLLIGGASLDPNTLYKIAKIDI